jgi:hypothetical protein
MVAPLAVPGGWEPAEPIVLPLPPELPGLPDSPRVLALTDGDCVSHGLVDGTARRRASNREVDACLARVHATAARLDPHARTRCAVSTETAVCHLDVLTAGPNNCFAVRRGLDGADRVLLEELAHLIDARVIATRPGRKGQARLADLVILVGQDKIYSQPVRQLRLLGIPTWLLIPSRFVAASLYKAAAAVTPIGPRRLA